MGFEFKLGERVIDAIPRLGCERTRKASTCLDHCETAAGIHAARKEIKKAKAVLLLAKQSISRKQFGALEKKLRKAAKCLAKPRDAAVQVKTLRDLSRRFKRELPHGGFRKLQIALRRNANEALRRFEEKKKAARARKILSKAGAAFKGLKLHEQDWPAIRGGLKQSYRECRDAFQRAVSVGAPEDFHDWRKRAKGLGHQLLMLEPIWPEQLNRMACELEAVGDLLGEDHDLYVLNETLRDFATDDELERLRATIAKRQQELRTGAVNMGKYFYEEKPTDFSARLEKYWRDWKSSGRRVARQKGRKPS